MNELIKSLVSRLNPKGVLGHELALHEVIQEIALLGLWRSKFFEHATFYGGSALRMLYGLNRFSQDLEFSLNKRNMKFSLSPYFQAIEEELFSFGFDARITKVNKATKIESAFIKANTQIHLLLISENIKVEKNKLIQIKFEVDKDPPLGFENEAKLLMNPTPFYVQTMTLENLFAGKMHALLYRRWGQRVKGRDWFDFLWYLQKDVPVHIKHFKNRAIQTGHLKKNDKINRVVLIKLLQDRISTLDVHLALKDVEPFVNEPSRLSIWSKKYFLDVLENLKVV